MPRFNLPRSLALGTAAAVCLTAAPAFASGFAAARFGGAHGNVVEYNPYAIYYNPAGLARVDGYQLSLDANFVYRTASYERPESAIDNPENYDQEGLDANSGEGNVSNLIVSPMAGFATDFGTGKPFGIGFGFYAPFGGKSVWDQVNAFDDYPGAVDGPNRWYVIEGTIQTLAFSLGAAYEIDRIGLSLGVSANLYLSTIDTVRARVATGTDSLAAEGRSWVDVSSTDLGLGVGAMWEAVDDRFFVGLSYQTAPGFNGQLEMTGSLTNVFPPSDGDPNDITMTHQLPDILRLGFRYREHRDGTNGEGELMPHYEFRLFGDLTRWSRLENQCVIDDNFLDGADPYDFCEIDGDGRLVNEGNAVVQNLRRNWNDAFGVRLGASYWFSNAVEIQLDASYDSNAIPTATLEPALMDFNKVALGIGGRFRVAKMLHIGVMATDVIYFQRDTTLAGTQEESPSPSRQPSSEGIYNQNIFLLNTNLDFAF